MRVHLLGPVEAWPDGAASPITPGPRMERMLLALLALSAGTPVPPERLIDELWPDDPPPRAASALQVYVSHLRKILGPDAIRTLPGGYVLDARTDVEDAAALLAVARSDLDAGRVSEASATFVRALDLWRGEPLSGLHDAPALAAASVRLGEERLRAIEGRLDAELAAGRHDAIAGELAELTAANPLREGLWVRRVTALYRQGRQAEALACVRSARTIIADALGVDPSPELAAVERAVLEQDPSLWWRPPPVDPAWFVGREQELAVIGAAMGPGRVVTISGPGGVGKTRTARRLFDEREGEGWFVELASVEDAAGVAAVVAEHLGVREAPGLPLDAAVAARLREASGSLVLDNAEHVLGPVGELLASAGPSLRVLVTSREPPAASDTVVRLTGLSLPGPDERALDADAVRLFCARAAGVRPGLVLSDADLAAVTRLCRGLDGLPLAIELAAARAAVLPVDAIAARLGEALDLLAALDAPETPHHASLRATVEWSCDLLDERARTAFRRVAVFGGAFEAADAEIVCADRTVDGPAVLDALQRLTSASLLEHARGGSLRMLDVVRSLALEHLSVSGEGPAVRARHLAHLVGRGVAAGIEDARPALSWAIDAGNDVAGGARLAVALVASWYRLGLLSEGRRWLELALERGADDRGPIAHGIGMLALAQGDLTGAEAATRESLSSAEAAGDHAAAARALLNLGAVGFGRGDVDAARSRVQGALDAAEAADDEDLRMRALNNLAQLRRKLGELDEAQALYGRALDVARRLRDGQAAVAILLNLGELTRVRGDTASARALFEDALHEARASDFRAGLAGVLGALGNLALAKQDPVEAADRFAESLTIARELGDRPLEVASLTNLAATSEMRGDDASAREAYEMAVSSAASVGDRRGQALATRGLVGVLSRAGSHRRAARELLRALRTWIDLREPERIADCLDAAASLAYALDDVGSAAWMLRAADDLLQAAGTVRDASSAASLQAVRDAIGSEARPPGSPAASAAACDWLASAAHAGSA